MEVVEGDQECHQERENQEKDGKSGGYGVLTTEILYKVVLTLSAQATFKNSKQVLIPISCNVPPLPPPHKVKQ